MDYPDSSPERRNLVLISLAFILFFAADGSLNGESVRFSLVNITFGNPEVIRKAAWLYLFWSLIRFYQKHGFTFWYKLKSDMLKRRLPKSMEKYAIDNAIQHRDNKNIIETHIKKAEIVNRHIIGAHFVITCNLFRQDDALLGGSHVPMQRVIDRLHFFRIAVTHSIIGNSFSEELLPYLLFLGAISGALIN